VAESVFQFGWDFCNSFKIFRQVKNGIVAEAVFACRLQSDLPFAFSFESHSFAAGDGDSYYASESGCAFLGRYLTELIE
jgi:hypothetical protein